MRDIRTVLLWIVWAWPLVAGDPFTALPDAAADSPDAPIRTAFQSVYAVDLQVLKTILDAAALEGDLPGERLSLPRPDGLRTAFDVVVSPIMAPALAAAYPEIRTYRVYDPASGAHGRLDLTPQGFHAAVWDTDGAWYLDPVVPGVPGTVLSYRGPNQARAAGTAPVCLFEGPPETAGGTGLAIGGELLEYRLALACTGEYAQYHGGTTAAALAAAVTALNRVDAIYERDLGIRMVLVADNDQILFLDPATDPYTNSDATAMLSQNQATLDTIIGSAGYDIGHVLGTGNGGVALAEVVCSFAKAAGVSGLADPVGDPFFVDYLAHELGHQWGAGHSFNGEAGACFSGREPGIAFEPGSGSTVMSYAGLCGPQDLQAHADAYFHGASFDQIIAFSRGPALACAQVHPSANTAPVVDAGGDRMIPAGTPFFLTGTALDAEQAQLWYTWEQFDLGPAAAPDTDDGIGPLVRSRPPNTDADRAVPRTADLAAGAPAVGEHPPTTDRTLMFRLTARDAAADGPGVASDTMTLDVVTGVGPFVVVGPPAGFFWSVGALRTVVWDPAGTDGAPIFCATVDLRLSVDGGTSFPQVVATGVPNTGSATVTVPNLPGEHARLMVACGDGRFFDISNADFVVTPLDCPAYDAWRTDSSGVYPDFNGNGLVDVADMTACLSP